MESDKLDVHSELERLQLDLSTLARDLYVNPWVTEVEGCPDSSLSFFRQYVSPNLPVVFRGAVNHWPAIKLWTNDYLRHQNMAVMGDELVSVSITPDGFADAVKHNLFVQPLEEQMSLNHFLNFIECPKEDEVVYIQKQCSNLGSQFSRLSKDINELSWAREAFDSAPDAINFWMGDHRAISSSHKYKTLMHKDPYENIYCVVRGFKDFILHPPSDLPWLQIHNFEQAIHKRDDQGQIQVHRLKNCEKVPWVTVDPLQVDPNSLYAQHATPVHVRVEAGDVLYLPSLWYHHVRQSQGCIAVNFWYDMNFDQKHTYFQFVSGVDSLKRKISIHKQVLMK